MKYTLLITMLLCSIKLFSQNNDSLHTTTKSTAGKVSFVETIDLSKATKEGLYLGGYVVHMDYERAKKLNGRKVQISGKVTIVKGLKDYPQDGLERQGRWEDTKHLLKPKIETIGK